MISKLVRHRCLLGVHTFMILTFLILLITTVFFIIGKFRSDVVAIASLLALTLTGIITPTEALAGFSNSVVIMIASLFIVGAGIFNTGLAHQIGNKLISLGNNNENRLLVIIMVTVGVFSAFISNTGTVAVLLPVVISIAMTMKISPAKLLIPLAFASSLGGVLTLIGTPPNLVASNMLVESGLDAMHFFSFTPIGLVALIAGVIFMLTLGKKLLPNHFVADQLENPTDPGKLVGIYRVHPLLHTFEIGKSSAIVGQNLQDLQLPDKYKITVVSIERVEKRTISKFQTKETLTPKAGTSFQTNDMVLLLGEKTDIERFADDYQLEKSSKRMDKHLLSGQYGISEMIVPPHSAFEDKTIRELQFRKKFNCSVLAIYRNGKYIQADACKIRLQNGDALLVHGEWSKMEAIAKTTTDLIVVGRVSDTAATEAARGKAPIAAGIMLLMLVLMTLELIDPVITVLIAAFLMIVTGCVRSANDAYQKINWESVILIAAMLPMATALENTGGVKFMSDSVIQLLGGYGPIAVLIGFYFLTTVLSQFISNTATAVIFAPVAITAALELGVSPVPFVVTIAVSASMAFATPVASPTNALVMNAGGYQFKDYVKVGVPLQIFLAVILLIFIPIFYPL